jgi:hypothetical protein
MSSANSSSRKHALLFAAAIFLLIAGFLDPRILYRLACHVGIMTAAFMVVCAFLAAQGIRRLADAFLRKPISPWFARSGVVVFLCIILPCINVVFIIIDNLFFNITAIGQVTGQQVRMFIFMALELLWIALLE